MTIVPGANRNAENGTALQGAYEKAAAFPLSRISDLAITKEQARAFAQTEASFRTIAIDEHGMSGGMRLNLLAPLRAVATAWRQVRSDFEAALAPWMADVEAVRGLQAEADAAAHARDNELAEVERELRQSAKYGQIDEKNRKSQTRYELFENKHGGRQAKMFATTWRYLGLIGLVMVTECFINYHAFNQFWGVPAVALGTTLVLGVLLALAAHGHGEALKQWSFRFGPACDPAMRWSYWRMFGISTAALAIVLGFTGWARWAAAIGSLGSQAQISALGNAGFVAVNPIRDVMISLIANLGAWMVGVIISYYKHDPDPEYMDATKQLQAARRRWNKARSRHEVRLKYIVAKHAKEIEDKTSAAQTREQHVIREINMLKQVTSRDGAVQTELEAVMTANVELYRDALVGVVVASQGEVQIVRTGTDDPFSAFDYKAMQIAPARIIAQLAA